MSIYPECSAWRHLFAYRGLWRHFMVYKSADRVKMWLICFNH